MHLLILLLRHVASHVLLLRMAAEVAHCGEGSSRSRTVGRRAHRIVSLLLDVLALTDATLVESLCLSKFGVRESAQLAELRLCATEWLTSQMRIAAAATSIIDAVVLAATDAEDSAHRLVLLGKLARHLTVAELLFAVLLHH